MIIILNDNNNNNEMTMILYAMILHDILHVYYTLP